MPPSTRARQRPAAQSATRSKQPSLTALWSQTKPDSSHGASTGLPSPAATPTKRKHSQAPDNLPSVKRARVESDDKDASENALPSPESTPTKQRQIPRTQETAQARPATTRIRNGRQLLSEFKGFTKSAQSRETSAGDARKLPLQDETSVKARSAALLDRLAEKQKSVKALPPPPTATESARKAALQRVPDVVRVLSLPRTLDQSSTRRSYSTVGLAQLVRQSARCVLGQEEVLEVLRLLEREEDALGCRGFVRFVRLGQGEAIVVDSAKKPRHENIEDSLRRLS